MKAAALLTAGAAMLSGADGFHLADKLPAHARGGRLYKDLLASKDSELQSLRETLKLDPAWSPNATANYKTSLVDNFATGGTSATFKQRFYFDTTFCGSKCFDPSTPIVCERTGEWTNTASASGAMAELAQKLGAVGCSLEHRQYGDSLMFPRQDVQNVKKYLTVEQSNEDFANFVPYFEAFLAAGGNPPGANAVTSYSLGFKPQRKWIIAGGSYAGALVSWDTVAHPELIAATWASSGVVNAIFDFTQFDQTTQEALGPDCAKAARAVTDAFESLWPTNSAQILQMYQVPTAPNGQQYFTKTDMAWALADSTAMASQYGAGALFCSYLNSTARPYPGAPMPPGGNYPTGMAALQAHAKFTIDHYGPTFAGCYYSTYCLANQASNPNLDDGTSEFVADKISRCSFWILPSDSIYFCLIIFSIVCSLGRAMLQPAGLLADCTPRLLDPIYSSYYRLLHEPVPARVRKRYFP
jgi:Serine carboxypeptidase S28